MMKRKANFLTVALTILTLSLSACGGSARGSSSSGGGSSSQGAGSQTAQAETYTDNNAPQTNFSGEPRPSDMTASNDLAPYIRKSLGDILKAFPEFTQLEGGEEHPAYGNDSLWFAFWKTSPSMTMRASGSLSYLTNNHDVIPVPSKIDSYTSGSRSPVSALKPPM